MRYVIKCWKVKERTILFPHKIIAHSGLSLGHDFSSFEVGSASVCHQTVFVGLDHCSYIRVLPFDKVIREL